MKPEDQRIAIATACGHKDIALRIIAEGTGMDQWVWCSGVIDKGGYEIPDYLTDLNAMHEAERATFVATSQWAKYGHQLQEVLHRHAVGIVPDYPRDLAALAIVAHATAAQRAEAFLRTLNLWTDA